MEYNGLREGDRVVAIAGAPYTITKKGNGYGIIERLVDDDEDDIVVRWTTPQGSTESHSVCSRWFVKDGVQKPKGKVLSLRPKESVREYIARLLKMEKDAERKKALRTFERCVLEPSVRASIDEAIVMVLRRKVFEEWGFFDHMEKGLTNSILLYGPPGTGKTMVSESIAAVLGMNLLVLGTQQLQSNIPGQMERNITESFQRAKKESAVVMLDECDSLLADRNDVGTIMAAEINALLTEIERFDGVVIMTTNRLHVLDPALQRRIIAKVELKMPTFEARKQIWKSSLPPKMPVGEVDFALLAEKEFSGGDIKNAVLLAARKAVAQNKRRVEMEEFVAATEMVWESKRNYERTRPQRVEVCE